MKKELIKDIIKPAMDNWEILVKQLFEKIKKLNIDEETYKIYINDFDYFVIKYEDFRKIFNLNTNNLLFYFAIVIKNEKYIIFKNYIHGDREEWETYLELLPVIAFDYMYKYFVKVYERVNKELNK